MRDIRESLARPLVLLLQQQEHGGLPLKMRGAWLWYIPRHAVANPAMPSADRSAGRNRASDARVSLHLFEDIDGGSGPQPKAVNGSWRNAQIGAAPDER